MPKLLTDTHTHSHWTAFACGDSGARDALLTQHLTLVHHVARQLEPRLSNALDHDELVSAGTLGLISAMSAFDHSRGLAFSTFAVPRIRGAILDELRRQDHVPRSVRRKTRDIHAAKALLSSKLGRAPEDKEVADALGIDLETYWRWESDIEGAVRIPIEKSGARDGDTHASPLDLIADPNHGIDERLGREQDLILLREAITKLNEQERTVIALYYFEELKLHEISEILGVTESRVSQIRSKALVRLRSAVGVVLA
jgi:RNA polymerase sigma factor for flagellar operon FliA